jgi:hypothetical protein
MAPIRRNEKIAWSAYSLLPRSLFRRGLMRLLAVLLVFFGTVAARPGPETSGNVNDFVEYWTAARQVLAGLDPYAAGPVLALERQVGFVSSRALIMRNPPWIVPVIAPLGLLSFNLARQLWFGLGLIAIFLSGRWLWEIYGSEGESMWIPGLSMALFLPIAVALAMGQISPLVLLGIAGFLHFEKRKKFVPAGAFLFLAALKPHLVFLAWAALLCWSIRARTIRTIAALCSITALASLVAALLDHSIFSQYFNLMNSGVIEEVTPTVSGWLRLLLGRQYPLQWLPALLAFGWFFFHWGSFEGQWQWPDEMPMLLLLSVLTIWYGWFFDQVVLLPCVFRATAWAMRGRRGRLIGIAASFLIINAAVLVLILEHRTAFWYAWTVPAWFLLYMFASATRLNRTELRGS